MEVMSGFTELAILVALFIAAAVVYILMDRLIQNHYDAAETGIARGVSVSVRYRRLLVGTRLVPAIVVLVSFLLLVAIGWVLLADGASDENAEFFAYLGTFMFSIGAFGWLAIGPFMVVHLARRVRQAEAD
jgi:hypothetical protein